MSAAVPDTPSPGEAAAPPPEPARKLTAARLLGALRKDARFREAMPFQDVVPYGAEAVLKAVCGLVAASPELGVYRLPEVLGARMCAVLGVAMKKVGAEEAIAGDLDALCAAGLVLSGDDGALTLPLDFAALTAPLPPAYSEAELGAMTPAQRASVANGRKGGRPRKDARVEGQRELPVHQVVAGTYAGSPAPRQETRRGGQVSADGNLAPEPGLDPGVSPGFLAEAAAAEEEVIFEFDLQQQQLGAGVAENPNGNPAGNPGGKPGAETQAASYDDAAVLRTVGLIALAAGLEPRQMRADDVGFVRTWLGLGLTPDGIVDAARRRVQEKKRQADAGRGGRPIGSISYFDDRMRETAGVALRKGGAAAQMPTAKEADARAERMIGQVAESWMEGRVRTQVEIVVRAIERGETAAIVQASIGRLESMSRRAAERIWTHYPPLRPDADEGQMREAG